MKTRMKALRAEAGLTQDDLAKRVGARRETIHAIENGKYYPSVKLAHDLAKVLGTTIDGIFVFDD